MSDYDNTNSGALFKNQKKKTEKHPDYTGSINVGGQEFWISSWLKTSGKGVRFMSLSVQPKEPINNTQSDSTQSDSTQSYSTQKTTTTIDDDYGDVPF